jgi:DNA polymerase
MDKRREATVRALESIGLGEVYLTGVRVGPRTGTAKRDKRSLLEKHFGSFKDCTGCDLHRSRSQVVFGDGNPDSPVVFVGEAPGEEEDLQGKPFVGRAGRYLNQKITEVMGLRREEVYITNVCKCRPPENRKPNSQEIRSCFPYLKKEIEIIKPKVICCLGSTAGEGILGKSLSITKVRGKVFPYPYNPSIKVFLTYHPAYILRNPKAEGEFLEDLRKLKDLIG